MLLTIHRHGPDGIAGVFVGALESSEDGEPGLEEVGVEGPEP